MTSFALSPRAQSDLEGIWDYTESRWGGDQAEQYLREMGATFELLAGDPRRGQDCGHIRRGYRKYAIGSHVIFYRLSGEQVDVIRILHARMDFDQRL